MQATNRGVVLALLFISLVLLVLVPSEPVKASTPIPGTSIVSDSSGTPNPQSCFGPGCSTTFSWSHTIGVGTNGILLVSLSHTGVYSATGVTFGAAALTSIGNHANAYAGAHVELWVLQNPFSGTGTITVTFASLQVPSFILGASASYFNVGGIGTVASDDDGSVAGTSASVTVATNEGDLVLDCLADLNSAASVAISPTGAGQTQDWNKLLFWAVGIWFAGGGSNQVASGSSVTMSWSASTTGSASNYWSLIAVPLIPVASPHPSPLVICVIQLGVQEQNGTITWLPGYAYPGTPVSQCQNKTDFYTDVLDRTITIHQFNQTRSF